MVVLPAGVWGPGTRTLEEGPVLPGLSGSVADNLGVDGAAHAVAQLSIQLGELVASVHTGLGDVPDSSSLNDVPDDELLDGLILGDALGTVSATHGLDMAPSVLVTAVVAAFGCHSLVEVNQASIGL